MNSPEAQKEEEGPEGLRSLSFVAACTDDYQLAADLANFATAWQADRERLREVEEALREIAEGVPMPEMATATTTRGGSGPASWRRLLTRDQARDRARQALTSDKGA